MIRRSSMDTSYIIVQPADDYLAARSRGKLCRHDTEHDAGDDGDESTLHLGK